MPAATADETDTVTPRSKPAVNPPSALDRAIYRLPAILEECRALNPDRGTQNVFLDRIQVHEGLAYATDGCVMVWAGLPKSMPEDERAALADQTGEHADRIAGNRSSGFGVDLDVPNPASQPGYEACQKCGGTGRRGNAPRRPGKRRAHCGQCRDERIYSSLTRSVTIVPGLSAAAHYLEILARHGVNTLSIATEEKRRHPIAFHGYGENTWFSGLLMPPSGN